MKRKIYVVLIALTVLATTPTISQTGSWGSGWGEHTYCTTSTSAASTTTNLVGKIS